MSNTLKLILSIVICQAAGLIGTVFTMDSIPTWYAALNKPAFNPPNWLFGPVWTLLYLMMGISLFIVWKEDLKNKVVKSAFTVFMIQLFLNTIWSIVFFGMQSLSGGLIIIILLWIMILITILKFMKISRVAGILLIPYLLWVSFATFLNFSIFKLN
ncbi:MAG TPA: tryptophan-rich sensory protein [Ignavibacteria bacterium]|nr:tryptophan-rich sensory protein [Ignavibacteria bacterium]